MSRSRVPWPVLALICARIFAQAPPPAFEVASIRTGAPFLMDLLRSGDLGFDVNTQANTGRALDSICITEACE